MHPLRAPPWKPTSRHTQKLGTFIRMLASERDGEVVQCRRHRDRGHGGDARRKTRIFDHPVVFASAGDPVGTGIVASLGRRCVSTPGHGSFRGREEMRGPRDGML